MNTAESPMLHRCTAIVAWAFILVAASATANEIYTIDPVHSQPMFEVQHMGFSLQGGSFGGATGTVRLDRVAKKGSIDVTIDTRTVKTIDPRLDADVKGEDFLNFAAYPTMRFKSTSLIFDGDWLVGAEGGLTMIGVTKPVSVKIANFICGKSAKQETHVRGGGHDHDQALRMGNEVWHSQSGGR